MKFEPIDWFHYFLPIFHVYSEINEGQRRSYGGGAAAHPPIEIRKNDIFYSEKLIFRQEF